MDGQSGVSVIPAIVGPTGSGKSMLARELADRTEGRLISVDSRKVYRRLDIGTAKPTPELIARYGYAMINVIEPAARYSAGQYAQAASAIIDEILAAGRRPILVGGTGLYLRALKEGLFEGPGSDEAIRAAIRREAEVSGWGAVHAKLQQVDPDAAAKIGPRNHPRLERALEVYYLTGEPITKWQRSGSSPPQRRWQFRLFGVGRPRAELYSRIEMRVDRMVQEGLFEEVEGLLRAGVESQAPGMRTLGYAEVVACLSGKSTKSEAIAKIKLNTRHYAKRQMTWFTHQEVVQWLPPTSGTLETVLSALA